MQWNIDGSSKFSSVDPVDKNFPMSSCDKYILVAGVDIEACNFAFINYEL
jgi:hypothetical protein